MNDVFKLLSSSTKDAVLSLRLGEIMKNDRYNYRSPLEEQRLSKKRIKFVQQYLGRQVRMHKLLMLWYLEVHSSKTKIIDLNRLKAHINAKRWPHKYVNEKNDNFLIKDLIL